MKQWLMGSMALALGALACGSNTDTNSLKSGTAALQSGPPPQDAGTGCSPAAEVPCTPPLPPLQYFAKWDYKTPFYKKSSQRATTIFMDEPGNSRRWIAIGADTVTGEFVFQVDGAKGAEEFAFKTEIGREVIVHEETASPENKFQEVMNSQGPVSPPHIGPNGTPDGTWVWRKVNLLERAAAIADELK